MLTTVVNSIKAPAELAEVISLWVAHEDSNECVISLHNNWDLIANRKLDAVRKLEESFEEGLCFQKKKRTVMVGRARNVEQEVTDYLVTAHTFKELCMILNNDKSKNVRKYLVAAEMYARKRLLSDKLEFEQKLLQQNDLLREQNTEREAHKCLSMIYYLCGKEKLTAEYPYYGRYFDFLYKDSSRIVIIELKVVRLTKGKLLNELTRKKDYLLKATQLAAENPTKKVVLKFVAPSFGSECDTIAAAMRVDYPRITIEFESWAQHIQPLQERAKQSGRNWQTLNELFGEINLLLNYRN